ncbi:MAG: putative toxin-antitoxin system toxin component, PIN family [Acidobacteriota bacterium]|nr:putative toxin-antitoxin system toxin component, PIN family [Acidobacteriota bacterium]
MALKKNRVRVVFDTNLFIARFIKHKRNSVNRRVIDLWQEQRRLQLIVSQPLIDEYLYVLENYIGIRKSRLELLKTRLETASYITRVNLGKRFYLSRDSKDNMFIDTAHIGKAKFVVSRDKDLLNIPKENLKGFRFEVVTPFEFLKQIGKV